MSELERLRNAEIIAGCEIEAIKADHRNLLKKIADFAADAEDAFFIANEQPSDREECLALAEERIRQIRALIAQS